MNDDGSLITAGTVFVMIVAFFIFAIGGSIIFLTLRHWYLKAKGSQNLKKPN